MKPYIKKTLDVKLNPNDFKIFRAFMAEYHEQINNIILEYGKGDDAKFLQVRNDIIKVLPPKDRMIFNFMRLLTGIGWDGLMGTLFNSDGKSIRDFRAAIVLSGSEFLLRKFDESIRLFRTKHNFPDPNSFFGIFELIKAKLNLRNPIQDETAENIDAIGDEIDNWEVDDIEKVFYKLSGT